MRARNDFLRTPPRFFHTSRNSLSSKMRRCEDFGFIRRSKYPAEDLWPQQNCWLKPAKIKSFANWLLGIFFCRPLPGFWLALLFFGICARIHALVPGSLAPPSTYWGLSTRAPWGTRFLAWSFISIQLDWRLNLSLPRKSVQDPSSCRQPIHLVNKESQIHSPASLEVAAVGFEPGSPRLWVPALTPLLRLLGLEKSSLCIPVLVV